MNKKTILLPLLFILLASCNQNEERKGNIIPHVSVLKLDTLRNPDGNIKQVETSQNGQLLKIDFFENGYLSKIIKYLQIEGRTTLNEVIRFNEKGDTLNNSSIYYRLFCVNDTITMQEDYDFLVALRGHLFDSARLYLCNFDKEFHLDKDSSKCAIFSMNNEHLDAPIAVSIKTKGWNYVRGKIDNYQNYKDTQGKDSSAYVSVYLLDSFYVKE